MSARVSPAPGKVMSGFGHMKSASTATLVSPGKAAMAAPASPAKTISVSNPPYPSTTPQGSPRRGVNGTLSASKSKLQSIMRTAKGLFTSSAGVSAAAKLETLSPNALHVAANNMPGLYPSIHAMLEDKPLPPSPAKGARKTRSSTEREKEERKREKEVRARQKMDDQLEEAREQEKQKAAQYKHAQESGAEAKKAAPIPPTRTSPRRMQEQRSVEDEPETSDMGPPAVPAQESKLSRPTKPLRETSQRSKPQPVAIRVGTLSQRMPMTTSSLASTLSETLQSSEARRPGPAKKASNASLQSAASNPTFKTSVSAQPAKPRALLAAERKKEQDEREAQRKADQKRELERKRAAQQEEARKQEQRQRQEAERKERDRVAGEQAKRAGQKQAIERKRLEDAKKLEQQRMERAPNDAVSRSGNAFQTHS